MSNLGDIISVPQSISKGLPSFQKKSSEVAKKLIASGQQTSFNKLSNQLTSRTTSRLASAVGTSGGSVTSNISSAGFGNLQSSAFSGSNPSSSQLASAIRSNMPMENNQNKTIITLKTYSQQDRQVIKFLANPTITDAREASYDSVAISHHPGEILKYRSTNSRAWSLSNIKLVSRTAAEATENLKKLNMIRSWVMPYYGQGTAEEFNLMFGAPPPVLIFSAYGSSNIDEHPVVLLNYNFSYPNDVDYIECQTDETAGIMAGTPFPVLCDISITLKESFSPAQFSGFSLSSYRNGKLSAAYIPPPPISPPISFKSSPSQTESQFPSINKSLQSVSKSFNLQKNAISTAATGAVSRTVSGATGALRNAIGENLPTTSAITSLARSKFEPMIANSVNISSIRIPVSKLGNTLQNTAYTQARRVASTAASTVKTQVASRARDIVGSLFG